MIRGGGGIIGETDSNCVFKKMPRGSQLTEREQLLGVHVIWTDIKLQHSRLVVKLKLAQMLENMARLTMMNNLLRLCGSPSETPTATDRRQNTVDLFFLPRTQRNRPYRPKHNY